MKRSSLIIIALILTTLMLFTACGEEEKKSSGNENQDIPVISSREELEKLYPDIDPAELDKLFPNDGPCTEHDFKVSTTSHTPSCRTITYVCQKCGTCKTEPSGKGHKMEKGKCTMCGIEEATNLEFAPTADGKAMEVIGPGSFTGTDLIIPSQYNGKPVVTVGGLGDSILQYVSIPDTVTKIADKAFLDAQYLKSISYPDTITEIGESAFENTQIESFTIPTGITVLKNKTFSRTYIKEITIPDTVTELGEGVFEASSLTKITLSKNITELPDRTFASCGALETISSLKNIKTFGYMSLCGCVSLDFSDMPTKNYTFDVFAFADSALEKITIPAEMKKVPARAFENCKQLEEVVFPSSLEVIERAAFSGCEKLKKIDLPKTLLLIDELSFTGTGIETLKINSKIDLISNKAFYGITTLKSVEILYCNSIADSAFADCPSLETVNLGSGVIRICTNAFAGSAIKNITIAEGLAIMEEGCFAKTAITTIILPKSLGSLAKRCFKDCEKLETIYCLNDKLDKSYLEMGNTATVIFK